MKCDICGAESAFDIGYRKRRKDFIGAQVIYCPQCDLKARKKAMWGQLRLLPVLAALGTSIVLWIPELRPVGSILINFVALNLFLVSTLIPHESAHALTAWALGLKVGKIKIGIGRKLGTSRLLGFQWDWHALPYMGVTYIGHSPGKFSRWKYFLTFLAGPAVNGLIALVLVRFFYVFQPKGHLAIRGFNPVGMLFFANLAVMLGNLYPRKLMTGLLELKSDGLAMWRLLFMNDRERERYEEVPYGLEAFMLMEKRDFARATEVLRRGLEAQPNSARLLHVLGVTLIEIGMYAEAVAKNQELLARDDLEPLVRTMSTNNMAWALLMLGRREDVEEAERLSGQAMVQMGWVPAIQGTRGSVLIDMGRAKEGLELVQSSFDNHDEPQSKALNACYLAYGYHLVDQREKSRAFLDSAKELDPGCFLIPKMEKRIGSGKL